MKRLLLPALALLAALGGAAHAAPSPPPGGDSAVRLHAQAANVSAHVLPNGFKIILAPFASAGTTRVELVVRVGSLLEGQGETGMAHLLEHMLFKGAGRRASIKSDLSALGARWNATTSADRTSYFSILPADADALDEALRIEADRFMRASFTQQDLASEMTVVRNELDLADSDPGSVMMRALQRQSFLWHGYGRPTIGARSDIEQAEVEALRAFYRRHYRPDNAFLVVSGSFDAARVLALAATLFSEAQNPAARRAVNRTREQVQSMTSRADIVLPAGKAMAMSAWKVPGTYDRQALALSLGAAALCSPEWGSLRRDVVLERKVAVAAGCSGWDQHEAGLFIASGAGDRDADPAVVARAVASHVESAAANGITAQALERAREEAKNAFARSRMAHESFAAMLSDAEVAGDWRLALWQHDVLGELTLEEVNAALRTWLVPQNRSDALLRHGEPALPAALPAPVDAAALVAGRDWASLAGGGDHVARTAAELAAMTRRVDLGEPRVQAALMSRKTQGDLAWVVVANDFGNEAALRGRGTACRMASALLRFGGAGISRDALDARMEQLRARWDLSLGRISVEAPRANIGAVLDALLAVWADPAMPAAEFERMKAAAVAGIEASLKDPVAVSVSLLARRFDNYPEQHPRKPLSIEDELAEIRAVRYEDVRACQQEFTGLARVRLAMVGDFAEADVRDVWARVSRLPAATVGYERVRDLPAPAQVDTTRIVVAMGAAPNATIMGRATLRIADDSADFPALRIAARILGDGSESRIWRRLRETQGLAYEAGAMLSGSAFEARSEFELSATAAGDSAETALASLQDELARALRDGFTEAEVAQAKQAWFRERAHYASNESLYAARLAQHMLNGRDFAWLAGYDERIAKVGAREATAALRKYLAEAPMVWVIGKGRGR